MHTKQFIEDAIEGGWGNEKHATREEIILNTMGESTQWEYNERILLDPLAWQAVGKTRDWVVGDEIECPVCDGEMSIDWRWYMHLAVEHIAMGKTIEETLEAISK